MRYLILTVFILALSLTNAFAGNASGSGNGAQPLHFTAEEVATFAKKVEKSLADKGARVAIVGRVGRDRDDLPNGINYTHVAYWVYSTIKTEDGRTVPGYHIYNLYQRDDDLDVSDLINDFPVDFFAGVYNLDAGIIIPKPEVQDAILKLIASGKHQDLHNPAYSVVASPFNDDYQNCTEYTLDILMSALHETQNMDDLKAMAKDDFQGQAVRMGPFKMLFGPLFVEDFKTRDHDGVIQTATFTTLAQFMKNKNLVDHFYAVRE